MIRIGIAGWDYPDWEGLVYPDPRPRGFDRLAYLSGFFDTLEINTTFYRTPDPRAAGSWARRVAAAPSFRFTAKLYRYLTHEAPPDLEAPQGRSALLEAAQQYRQGIEPIRTAGRLGAVLMQFPHAFHDRPDHRRRLEILADGLADLPLVAEFRHRSWDHEDALRFLSRLRVGFCNIDQPAIAGTLRPTGHVTSRIAYIRLHGRNAEAWFRSGGDAARRYDYLYTQQELAPWAERVLRLDDRAEEVFVIANNHYRGKAPVNALMLKAAVTRRRVPAPPALVAAFKELADSAVPVASRPLQGRLFGDGD
ncbi:MAG TPA: DUF72 domain-containing protein [Candidatus Polarisedimenticolia bacterium]|nr:DUF72 domain-containing protein [Candidatus Polarisedimenticolia bacterium]